MTNPPSTWRHILKICNCNVSDPDSKVGKLHSTLLTFPVAVCVQSSTSEPHSMKAYFGRRDAFLILIPPVLQQLILYPSKNNWVAEGTKCPRGQSLNRLRSCDVITFKGLTKRSRVGLSLFIEIVTCKILDLAYDCEFPAHMKLMTHT